MTQEDKQLLLKDLCARLPYGVIIKHKDEYGRSIDARLVGYNGDWFNYYIDDLCFHLKIHEFKPYLRPLSSMSDEEYEEFGATRLEHQLKCLEIDEKRKAFEVGMKFDAEDLEYLYSHHYDVHGLIPKGLALSTEEFNPYKD